MTLRNRYGSARCDSLQSQPRAAAGDRLHPIPKSATSCKFRNPRPQPNVATYGLRSGVRVGAVQIGSASNSEAGMYRWIDHTGELELQIDADAEEDIFREAVAALAELIQDGGQEATEPRELA